MRQSVLQSTDQAGQRITDKNLSIQSTLTGWPVPDAPNVTWSMDLMADHLGDGCPSWLLNVLDGFNREGLGIEVDCSLPAERVIRSLNHIMAGSRHHRTY